MKRYATLKCSACARTKDELIDQRRYTPDRCTITLNCEGRLAPISYTSAGSTILSVPPDGVTNWYPRGSTLNTPVAIQPEVMYNTSTGTKQQLVLAVYDPSQVYGPSAVVQVNMIAEQQTPKEYRQYTYRRSGSITIVNGVEDGQAKKVLRYNTLGPTPDVVEVYVDGVKRSNGTGPDQYQLYDGTVSSPVPLNSVLFNTPVTGVAPQVDVIVTKATTPTTVSFTFTRAVSDESRLNSGAWEGVNYVSNAVLGKYSLFYCDFSEISAGLAVDVKFRLDAAAPSTITNGPTLPLDTTKAAILLSREQLYTQLDRQRSMWIVLATLSSSTNYLMTKLTAGVKTLVVTESAISNIFPVLEVTRFSAPELQTSNLQGNSEASQLDNTIIIGPDA